MKSYKVVLFIFSVIVLLGLLCVVFPAEGVNIGEMSLEFPTLEEALGGGKTAAVAVEEDVETPEEILARRLAELRTAEESQYVDFCKNSPIRIWFPDNNLDLFNDFFDALDSARIKPMRIVHYGDSQLEEDRITNNVREQLQERFGGNGVGLVPLIQTYTTLTLKQKRSASANRSIVYGSKEFSVPAGRYGPMGQAARLSGNMDVTYYPNSNLPEGYCGRYYSKVTVLTESERSPISVTSAAAVAERDTLKRPMRRYTMHLNDTTDVFSFRLSGVADVYGIMLDGETGVSLDNVAMRGCSGTVFTKMDAAQLADYYQNENVKLIILQYGGNVMPYIKVGKALDAFAEKIYTQIKYVQAQAPGAAILFIGPSDMTTSKSGAMQTYPALPAVVDTLRNVSNRAGAAYWDIYTVMGGRNSMVEWVRSGYAGKDHVHFTHKGANEVGNLLAKSLFLYYDYYKWRTKPLDQQLTPEVVETLMREPEPVPVAEPEPAAAEPETAPEQIDTIAQTDSL